MTDKQRYNLKIWTGPCGVKEYAERFRRFFAFAEEVSIIEGTEHVYINGATQSEIDCARMSLHTMIDMLDHSERTKRND